MATNQFGIQKFDGLKKFEIWKLRIRAVLALEGLHKPLLGEAGRPENIGDEVWEEMDLQALSTIHLSVTDDVLMNIKEAKTAAEAMAKIESSYRARASMYRLSLKNRYYSLRMEEGMEISDHLDTFNDIVVQLENLGVKIDEEDKAMKLLCTLPESYSDFVDSMVSAAMKDTFKFGFIHDVLLAEDNRNKAAMRSLAESTSNVECWFCHKSGHKMKSCLERRNII